MRRRSTIRLPVAILTTVALVMVSIVFGRADAAILAAPWAVLLVLGLSRADRREIVGTVVAESDRVVIGDRVSIRATVTGADGRVRATCRPQAGFWPDDSNFAAKPAVDDVDDIDSVADVARPGRVTDLEFSLTASAWGTHDLGRIQLQIEEPYGLLQLTGVLYSPTRLRVHPRAIDLQQLLAPWFVRRLSGAHESRTVGRGVEYADIRPFGAGDSLRDINWRASARAGELWVSQRHPDRSTDVVLLLDTFTESGHDVRTALGLAIEAAVALAESHLSVTDRVGLIELGGIVRWVTPGAGRHQLERLADTLLSTVLYENAATLRPLIVPPRALPPRSFIVALSPLLDDRFVEQLLVLRAAGHDVSVVECPVEVDPDRSIVGRLESSGLAHRLWQAERAVTRDQLAEQGVVTAQWRSGDHFDLVLADLGRRRRGVRVGATR